jgi:hypothetical protein
MSIRIFQPTFHFVQTRTILCSARAVFAFVCYGLYVKTLAEDFKL